VRLAVDTGGTFTDLVVEDERGQFSLYKSATTPDDPVCGVLDVLDIAARDREMERTEFLDVADLFIHGTTRAINAILTGATAKTALLTTKGHPDILLLREGGRTEPFNFTREYPDPYVPRSLTYEVPERVRATGEIVRPLDEFAVVSTFETLGQRGVEAVAVCLLWSIVNPAHELRIGQLLDTHLPGVPYTLSHQLNPSLREYRRASSTAIDASLKPIMTTYLASLEDRLRAAGFQGRVLVVTSAGGVLDARAVAQAPIHSIGSGPAMAPVAGRHYAQVDAGADTVVIADAGGTSYDVSLVRRGRIPWTRETWLGQPYLGHMTGFPSVDVKSIGAGGGSIAWVDEGGLLHVGPQSAGAVPGPACYGRGGSEPTVTDASLVLGYLDPHYFLGGSIELDVDAATRAIERRVATRLALGTREAAAAVLKLTTERMVRAIEEITLSQGIDPRVGVLVGGGGAAGLNAVAIARRLGCSRVIIPHVAAALSAAGALMSDLAADYAATVVTTSGNFDFDTVNRVLSELDGKCHEFISGPGVGALQSEIEFTAEARYPHQIWELEVPLQISRFAEDADVEQLRCDFHALHKEVFAIDDPESPIEIVTWRARVRCRLHKEASNVSPPVDRTRLDVTRSVYFAGVGEVDANVRFFEAMEPERPLEGPAIIESPVTTVVLEPGASALRSPYGSLVISPWLDDTTGDPVNASMFTVGS
jgi:N-methylhydantoinase A